MVSMVPEVATRMPRWRFVTRALPLRPALTGAIAGVSAGAFGLALLTLNCPVLEGPHLAVFHGGVLVLSLVTGALASFLVRR